MQKSHGRTGLRALLYRSCVFSGVPDSACLTVYDMLKAIDRSMVIGGVHSLGIDDGLGGQWAADVISL